MGFADPQEPWERSGICGKSRRTASLESDPPLGRVLQERIKGTQSSELPSSRLDVRENFASKRVRVPERAVALRRAFTGCILMGDRQGEKGI